MNYKALIVDDESGNRELLKRMIQKYCLQIGDVHEAESSSAAIAVLQDYTPDVVFLDIEMPGGSGFDFLKALPEISFKIIFVTAYDSYALQAIKYSALDYLLKPVVPSELQSAVEKLEEVKYQQDKVSVLSHNLSDENKKIALSTQDEIIFVEASDIIRLEAEANYTRVYFKNEDSVLLSGNLGTFEKLLKGQTFFRSHQSHLVNLRHIKKYVKTDGGYLQMQDESQVPVARMKKEEFKKLFF